MVSVDGVGAYDHIARAAMFEGLRRDARLASLMPFVRQFYGRESTYIFYDHAGQAHEVAQAEGGEQGDPLMPGLFAVGIHPALLAAHAELGPRADLYAFLDDTYVACDPADACAAFVSLRSALKRHANIDVHLGKTRVWNSTGEQPPGLTEVLPTAPGEAPVWVDDHSLPPQQQGFLVLGTPFGSEAYKKEALRTKGLSHGRLLDRIPSLPDLQSAWLLLLMCAAPRSNYLLRSLAPSLTDEFARTHDDGIARCLADLLANDAPIHIDDLGRRRAALPLKLGGLGLRRAQEGRDAAYWASWADTLPVLHQSHPTVVAEVLRRVQSASLEGPDETTPDLAELAKAATRLQEAGFALPTWDALAVGGRPPPALVERTLGEPLRGWQRAAAACLDASACTSLLSDLDPASRPLMLSQAGPGGSRALTALPTAPEFRLPSSCFRVVLLRRLRLPVPIGPRRCRCGGALDALGDHRTACPTAGVLGARGAALERAAARVCREAGARVATNVFLRDMNVDVPLADGRRIEVLANGLPLWQGAQAAVDTTLVSPVTRAGGAHPQADRVPGNALEQAAKRKRLHTYPELAVARRCKLVVIALEVGGRFGPEAVAFLRQLARARARESPARLRPAVQRASLHRWTGMLAVAAQRALAY